MIEHPEAVTIAAQMADTLAGKRIKSALAGSWPHKFAFYSRAADEYAAILAGRSITGAEPSGALILVRVSGGYTVVLGGGGERILYHASADTVPQKHQLLLEFDDDTWLSVTVQGWGSVGLDAGEGQSVDQHYSGRTLAPTDEGFTSEYFEGLFAPLASDDSRSVKNFIISDPGIHGLGNGYLQDILLAARIHPRTRAADLSAAQRRSLRKAIVETIGRAVRLQGRTDEHDLFGKPGGYARRLSAAAVGLPCPACGKAAIVKDSFLGGAIYTCPECQPAPPRPERRARKKA